MYQSTQSSPEKQADGRDLDHVISTAISALLSLQKPDGHWIFELEADATIPAEYILLRHYLDEPVDGGLEAKIGAYLRRIKGDHGGWPLFHGGPLDVSASVKAYFALKMIGDKPVDPHMQKARDAIRRRGGAAQSNIFTRFLLALYGIVSWRATPVMPVEIMLLPAWFPFHLDKISYWARTVMVPLLVLGALKPRARNPRGVTIDELFLEPPETVGMPARAAHQSRTWRQVFKSVDWMLRRFEWLIPDRLRQHAIKKAVAFVTTRLNGEDGLGAIYPAMANSVMMFDALGYPKQHPDRVAARCSIERLIVEKSTETYCQPCVSPVWDTALVCHTLLETAEKPAIDAAVAGLRWLKPLQVLDVRGDWSVKSNAPRPGGWAFQYANPWYPDLDDTAAVVMAMDRARRQYGEDDFAEAIERGREWVAGLQCANGGWGAFDADNNYLYLNNIPFSDHGALLDPPTEDVTGRCVSMLAQLGQAGAFDDALKRGVDFLLQTQREDGSWYGRWGMNYIYGTWSALCALNCAAKDGSLATAINRACDWLEAIQNADGGWGENGASYKLDYRGYESAASTASQTAWALLGLMAGGRAPRASVARGIDYLLRTQNADGLWSELHHTATGFPRVFFLRYHGYPKFFPLWALARFRNMSGLRAQGKFGM